MRVLYIDVYFLINFTVDLLSLYFSLEMLHFSSVRWRLALSALVGAAYASLSVLFYTSTAFLLILSFISLIGMVLLISPGAGLYRRMKLLFLFLFLQAFCFSSLISSFFSFFACHDFGYFVQLSTGYI